MISSRVLVGMLALTALFQGGILVARSTGERPRTPPVGIAVGDTIRAFNVAGPPGTAPVPLTGPAGKWTVLLAFRSTCVWCDSVAPRWTAWLGKPHPARVLGITSDTPDSAAAYRDAKRWRLELVSAPGQKPGSVESSLLSRTPWVYVLDENGVVRYHGHGNNLPQVDSLLAERAAVR
jgi:peroxiredoxin